MKVVGKELTRRIKVQYTLSRDLRARLAPHRSLAHKSKEKVAARAAFREEHGLTSGCDMLVLERLATVPFKETRARAEHQGLVVACALAKLRKDRRAEVADELGRFDGHPKRVDECCKYITAQARVRARKRRRSAPKLEVVRGASEPPVRASELLRSAAEMEEFTRGMTPSTREEVAERWLQKALGWRPSADQGESRERVRAG